jgi:hypothetical protein
VDRDPARVRGAVTGPVRRRPRASLRRVAKVSRSLLVVSSSGGVLLDVWALRPWWERHTVRWVAVPAPDTVDLLAEQDVVWAEELRPADLLAVARSTVRAWRMLRSSDVDLVVSAGSGVAVPYFLAARVARVPAWWVETLNVSGGTGLAARLCCRLADRVLVQHDELLEQHRRAVHVGELY